MDFVEIGTSDFDTLLQNTPLAARGLTIEPIGHYLNNLPDRENVAKMQMLVSDENGVDLIYYIDPKDVERYNLPWEVKGMNCIGHPHPGYDFFKIDAIRNNNIEIKKDTVEKITLYGLLMKQGVTSVGYLKIDTEGHDCVILSKFLRDVEANAAYHLLPNCVLFESNQWTNNALLKQTISDMSKYYTTAYSGHDTIMVKVVSQF